MAEQNPRPNPPKKRRRRRRRSMLRRVLTVIGTLFLVGVITCSFLACFAAVYIKNVILPKTDLDVAEYEMNLSSIIYFIDPVTGEEVEYETLHGDQNRVWVEYNQLPQNLINALVSIEDRRFYTHHGVDWIRTAKSALVTFTGGRTQGGSTITQQLIKNVTQYDDVTVKRKVLEIFMALEFDKKYSKAQTLEWYMNYVYFGRKCYGVYTAAYTYFGKNVSELSLAECASLIGITNNPSLYDPYTNPENNKERQELVLDAMKRDGFISEEQCEAAKKEELVFRNGRNDNQQNTFYSWYTEQVITDVTRDLMAQFNYSEQVAENIVYSGGLKIYACVDTRVQAKVDNVYSNTENLPYTSPSGQQLQSAITVIDNQGNVVALAGKIGEKTSADTRGYNMATRALRQPGSSIKPLAVYAPALEMELITPYSVFEDSSPMLLNDEPWPSNVNHRNTGQMTVLKAVTDSTNTVAVRVLQQVTPAVAFEYLLDKFGVDETHLVTRKTIRDKEYSDIGYSQLALGGLTTGVSTLDMASAYSVFPRNGVYVEPRTYSKVVNANDEVILTKDLVAEPVLKEKTVYYINEMLKNVVAQGSGTAAQLPGMTVAGKTGTTNSYNDRWFVGYTPYYTAAVWVGYQTPERITGPSTLTPDLWKQVMSQVHEGLEYREFPGADGLVARDYCMDTGLLAGEECQSDMRGSRVALGYYFPEDVPTEYCQAHVMVEVCTADPILNENGEPTGRYHLAGEFCPEVEVREDGTETPGRISVSILDIQREYVGDIYPEDNGYFKTALEIEGFCTVHTEAIVVEPEPYDPSKFNILDPSTWPTREEDPSFDSRDPSTWPFVGGHIVRPGETSPGHSGSENPGVSGPPVTIPEPPIPPVETHAPTYEPVSPPM